MISPCSSPWHETYPRFSVISIPLLEGLKEQFPQMDIRALYDLYPDSSIDLWEERKAVAHSSLILVVHPVFWFLCNQYPAAECVDIRALYDLFTLTAILKRGKCRSMKVLAYG